MSKTLLCVTLICIFQSYESVEAPVEGTVQGHKTPDKMTLRPVRAKEFPNFSDAQIFKRSTNDDAYRRSTSEVGQGVDYVRVLEEGSFPKDVLLAIVVNPLPFTEVNLVFLTL